MSSLEVLLAVAGFVVTALVVAGMILITPRGQVPVDEDLDHPENAHLNTPICGSKRCEPPSATDRPRPVASSHECWLSIASASLPPSHAARQGELIGQPQAGEVSGVRNVVMSAIRSPRSVSTLTPCGRKRPRLRVPEVVAERELPVDAGGDEPRAVLARERVRPEEARDRVAAAVPRRSRRHRERGVVGEQATTASTSPCSHAWTYWSTIARRRSSPSARSVACWLCCGEALVDRLVGALERAVDRGRRRLERVGDLAGGEAEHVAQDQHRALARRRGAGARR